MVHFFLALINIHCLHILIYSFTYWKTFWLLSSLVIMNKDAINICVCMFIVLFFILSFPCSNFAWHFTSLPLYCRFYVNLVFLYYWKRLCSASISNFLDRLFFFSCNVHNHGVLIVEISWICSPSLLLSGSFLSFIFVELVQGVSPQCEALSWP